MTPNLQTYKYSTICTDARTLSSNMFLESCRGSSPTVHLSVEKGCYQHGRRKRSNVRLHHAWGVSTSKRPTDLRCRQRDTKTVVAEKKRRGEVRYGRRGEKIDQIKLDWINSNQFEFDYTRLAWTRLE